MKKFILMVVAFVGFATAASAQTFDVGVQNITLNAGFGGGYNTPIGLSYEQGIVDFGGNHKLGLGGYLGFGDANTFIAAECNYHFVGVKKLDLYGGARLGYIANNNNGATFTSIDFGLNYYFASAWAINAEFGSGLSALSLGVTYKF